MASAQEAFDKRLADAERRQRERSLDKGPLDGGGGGPHPPDMEARVAKLEGAVQGIDKSLRELVPSIKQIADGMPKLREDVAELKGRMTGIEGQLRQVPTLWSIGGTMLAINAGIVAVAGLAVALLRHPG